MSTFLFFCCWRAPFYSDTCVFKNACFKLLRHYLFMLTHSYSNLIVSHKILNGHWALKSTKPWLWKKHQNIYCHAFLCWWKYRYLKTKLVFLWVRVTSLKSILDGFRFLIVYKTNCELWKNLGPQSSPRIDCIFFSLVNDGH